MTRQKGDTLMYDEQRSRYNPHGDVLPPMTHTHAMFAQALGLADEPHYHIHNIVADVPQLRFVRISDRDPSEATADGHDDAVVDQVSAALKVIFASIDKAQGDQAVIDPLQHLARWIDGANRCRPVMTLVMVRPITPVVPWPPRLMLGRRGSGKTFMPSSVIRAIKRRELEGGAI